MFSRLHVYIYMFKTACLFSLFYLLIFFLSRSHFKCLSPAHSNFLSLYTPKKSLWCRIYASLLTFSTHMTIFFHLIVHGSQFEYLSTSFSFPKFIDRFLEGFMSSHLQIHINLF